MPAPADDWEVLQPGSLAYIDRPMHRRTTAISTALLLACVWLVAAPAGGLAAAKVTYPFKFGTYKGKLSTGGAVQIRLRKASCDQRRQFVVLVKGACLRILELQAPSAGCPDGTSVAPVLDAYLVEKEEIHLPKSGSYSDLAATGIGAGTLIASTTLKFTAKGSRITGSVKVTGLQQSDTSVQCATAAATFTAKL